MVGGFGHSFPPADIIKMEKQNKKDYRSVRCFICRKKMYYSEHPKWEPEYILEDDHDFLSYVHVKCIKVLKKQR